MVKLLNNKVLEKIDEIIDYIKKSDSYIKYKEIEQKCLKILI